MNLKAHGFLKSEPGMPPPMSWRWLFTMTIGLLSTESRLQRVLRPFDPKTGA